MGVYPCLRLSFRTDSTALPQSLTRDIPDDIRAALDAIDRRTAGH
jgi:hypothetical protein